MKIEVKIESVYVADKDGKTVKLEKGINEVEAVVANKLIGRNLATVAGSAKKVDESKDEK